MSFLGSLLSKSLFPCCYPFESLQSGTDQFSRQVGKFVIGEPEPENEMQIPEEMVPEGRRFPAMFRGQGVRGHYYQVFNEPRYWQ